MATRESSDKNTAENDLYNGTEPRPNCSSPENEDYEYDYDDSMTFLPLPELVPVSLVYGLTFVLGVLGNTLVIICVARFRRMYNVTNVLLVSLASADLLLVSACVPIKFAKWFTFTWIFGEFLCKSVHYLQNVSVICSVLTLTLISLERYYAILYPMHARYICTPSRVKKLVALVWIASHLLALPILFGQALTRVGVERIGFWCVKEWSRPLQEQIYEVGMLTLVLVFPLCVMTFAYVNICLELWTVLSNRSGIIRTHGQFQPPTASQVAFSGCHKGIPSAQNQDDQKTRQQVIKMLVAIVALFGVCWAPTLVDNVLVSFGVLDRLHYGPLKHLRQAFACLSYANSCVNPIVYALMSKNFRNGFKSALCACAASSSDGLRDLRHGGGCDRGAVVVETSLLQGHGVDLTPATYSSGRAVVSSFELGRRQRRLRITEIV